MLHLVAVGNQHRIVLHARHIHVYRYAAACRHRAEVLSPCRQFLLQVEAVEVQLSLVVLHLAEVKNLAYKLYQYSRVALHHLQHRTLPTLYRRVFEQLFCRSGDERQRCAQFVTHVREELQLRLRHFLHLSRHFALLFHRGFQLSVDAGTGEERVDGCGAHHDEQHHEHEQHEQVDALRVEVVGSLVHTRAKRREMVLLSYRLVVLHEQHTSVVARHECRRELGLSVVFLSRQYFYGELHHLIAASGVGV